ncbi:pirin family protein [Sphingomonas sp. OTU376]|uniref:pirin family protein n=1 Tax=Sphingomonas sp. OTU376 TaxID=3043863 RepID=UPI00313B583D
MQTRELERRASAFRTLEGDGIEVLRAIPANGLESVGPFIFLDHFGPIAWKPGEEKGASAHPHAGIETMTLLLEGRMRHKDSLGNASTMAPGDVQWMRAGSGIVHDEQPDVSQMKPGDRTHGVQLWLNLPKGSKAATPEYRHIVAREIPVISPVPGVRLRLIAGAAAGLVGPLETFGRAHVLHVSFDEAAAFDLDLQGVPELAAYAMLGSARLGAGEEQIAAGELAVLGQGNTLRVAAPAGSEILIVGGEALDAPILRYGPFVMNTAAELEQTILAFQRGAMGRIAA